ARREPVGMGQDGPHSPGDPEVRTEEGDPQIAIDTWPARRYVAGSRIAVKTCPTPAWRSVRATRCPPVRSAIAAKVLRAPTLRPAADMVCQGMFTAGRGATVARGLRRLPRERVLDPTVDGDGAAGGL